jgi:Triose-phosphate Transporter family
MEPIFLTRSSQLGSSLDSSFAWLSAYFTFNLSLTIYNKLVLAGNFPFPYTLTAIHCFCGTLGSYICLKQGIFKRVGLTYRDTALVSLFSVLYTVNILVSNLSLYASYCTKSNRRLLVTVPFHQIVRSTTPLVVIAIAVSFLKKSFTWETYLSLIPVFHLLESCLHADDKVILGVALATAGDYYFTMLGFLLTLLGTLLAALKTIFTNQIQKSISSPMHQLDVLLRMSPLACIQSLMYATALGETSTLRTFIATLSLDARFRLLTKLAVNGALAFALNYASFTANNKTSPLTMTVAANIKQCLSIVLGVWIFRLQVGWMNAIGIIITLAGGAWYAKVELGAKGRHTHEQGSSNRLVSNGMDKLSEKEIP